MFYLANLFLNFNLALPLALLSLPALAVTYRFDFRRLGVSQTKPKPGQSSPYTLVALRLSGFYLWLIVMSAQPHKEERFMYPAYPLLCMNAAVTVFLIKGWAETAFVKATTSPYRVSPVLPAQCHAADPSTGFANPVVLLHCARNGLADHDPLRLPSLRPRPLLPFTL